MSKEMKTDPNKYVVYLRVSTARQGQSGLGLRAQNFAVEQLAKSRNATIVAEYVETESGRKSDRPQLAKALAEAKKQGCTLVVAKLDRLARNVSFISSLMESGVEFIACDIPSANRLVLHIMAAVAEEEARLISERTKTALAAAKARGVKLGSARPGHWEGREHLRGRGAKASTPVPRSLILQMVQLRSEGKTFQQISDLINAQGHRTAGGLLWTRGLIHRFAKKETKPCSPQV
jgi:DNA invertase Pin-like site-specific DNA recombinase